MSIKRARIASYVDRGNKLISEGKTEEAARLTEEGFSTYTSRVLKAISPYAASDAGMIVLVLRHIADEIVPDSPWAGEFAEKMAKIIKKPSLDKKTKLQKPNRT